MDDLERSRKWCAAVMREHSKSFYLSTRVLPKPKRDAIEALYGLFRYTDDAADEPGPSLAERRAAFASIRLDLERLADPGHESAAPWFAAVRAAFGCFEIDPDDVRRLVDGCESDLDQPQIRTLADLERYSALVAGTVGRCTVAVLGAVDGDSLRRAERLGIAMQFTNVLRDIEEDRLMGRSYLPFEAFPDREIPEIMRSIAQIARSNYRESRILAARVPNDGSRAALLMASSFYEGILDRLDRRGFDPSLGRVHVPLSTKVTFALRSLIDAYAGF